MKSISEFEVIFKNEINKLVFVKETEAKNGFINIKLKAEFIESVNE